MKQYVLATICGAVLVVILVAGLWPFNPWPKNEVSWLGNENGLGFGGKGGILLSAGPLIPGNPQAEGAAGTLELGLQPARDYNQNPILTLFRAENLDQFRVRQYFDLLVVDRKTRDRESPVKIGIDHVFQRGKQVFITITSGDKGTAVYIDGVLADSSQQLRLTRKDLSGRLVIGTSTLDYETWAGQIRGLAVSDRTLNASEVLRHYQMWTGGEARNMTASTGVRALYLFDEHEGRIAHDHLFSGTDLVIPKAFKIMHKQFLEMPWVSFRLDRSYWKDVIINIAGFVPLGFFFYAYFSLSAPGFESRIALRTIFLGGAISILIEVLQFYLPTRDSSLTDIITNTLGTALGVMLHRWGVVQTIFARIGIVSGEKLPRPMNPSSNI